MKKPAHVLLLASTLWIVGGASGLQAARSGRSSRASSDGSGGSARRAERGGEALAQTFYERSVAMGQRGEYGQAKVLMERAVEKNPSNEKYRYYLALLMYKIGDFGDAAAQCRKLKSGRTERYRTKSEALLSRIEGYLSGKTEIVASPRPADSGETWSGSSLQVLPPDAYVNIAGAASRSLAGKEPRPSRVQGSAMTPEAYRGYRDDRLASLSSDAAAPVRKAAPPPSAASAPSSDPSAEVEAWSSPPEVEAPDPAPARPADPSPPAAAPAKPPAAPAKPAPMPSDDEFASVFEENPFAEEPPAKTPPPAAAKPPPPTKAPAAAKPAPPAPPPPATSFDEFDDGAFDEPAPPPATKPASPPPATKPAAPPKPAEPAPATGFDEDAFEEF